MKRSLAVLLGLLVGFVSLAARADVLPVSWTQTFTATGYTPWVALNGQTVCSVLTTGSGSGLTIVPLLTSDTTANIAAGSPVAVTATTIGSGSISANGTNTGSIGGTALTGFQVHVSAISGGTEVVSFTCTGTGSPSGNPVIAAGTNSIGTVGLNSGSNVVGVVGEAAVTGNGASTVAFTPLAAATPVAAIAAPATVYTGYYTWDSSVSTTTGCTIQLWDAATVPTLGTTPAHQWYFATGSTGGTFAFPIPITLGVKVANELWIGVAAGTALNGTAACNTSSAHAGFGFTYK